MDIVTEVFAGGLLSIMAGIIALLSGAYVVAAVVLGTSITVTSLWMVLFFLSSKRTFQVPKVLANLARRFAKEKSYMKSRWSSELLNDPYYNPNLSLESEHYRLRD